MRNLAAAVGLWPYRIAVLCLWPFVAVATPPPPTAPGATLRFSRTVFSFSSQVVGTSSASQSLTITNDGMARFVIAKLTVSGDFSETNNCGGELAIRTSCTIDVTFTPAAKGLRKGDITIFDNAVGSPQGVHLQGIGTQAKLSVDALSFEGQPVRSPSDPKLVTLTNIGNAPLKIAAIRITPPIKVWGAPLGPAVSSIRRADEFAETNGCRTSLTPGGSCTINVSFTPRRPGSFTAWLIVSDDGSGSSQRVTLWGVGLR